MRRGIGLFLGVGLFVIHTSAYSQIFPPKHGVDLPQAYLDVLKQKPKKGQPIPFQFERAWKQKSADS